MNRIWVRALVCLVVLVVAVPMDSFSSGFSSATQPDILLASMQRELQRATAALAKANPAPYYISYTAADINATVIFGISGSIAVSSSIQRRQADVIMRVGSAALDNTHSKSRASGIMSSTLPLSDNPDAIGRVLWQLTDREYEQASAAFLKVKTNTAVQSEEEDKSPDFSQEPAEKHINDGQAKVSVDQKAWENRIRTVSGAFLKYPEIYSSVVYLQVSATRSYLATSEGTALVHPSEISRLVIQGETRADDGMDLLRVETFQAATPGELPSDAELRAKVDRIASDLQALRKAPAAEPYAGPAMLSGRASAVFFHEVLGHRLEGHRQKDQSEGQTFTKKVNQKVLPEFLSVTDDPTLKELNGVELAGTYSFDDEGVPAERVVADSKTEC